MHKRRHHNPQDHHHWHRAGHHGGPGFGADAWGGFGPGGPGGWFGPGRGHGGPARARKGDVRAVILTLLAEGPSNGYGLIRAIHAKTSGMWKPSAGSVYPTLQQLQEEGLIQATGTSPRSEFELTDEGRAHFEEHKEHLNSAWKLSEQSWDEHGELVESAQKLAGVVRQVAIAGTPDQRTLAVTKLNTLRRELYRMLGE